jgi:glutathione-dependent peroxiredoxin
MLKNREGERVPDVRFRTRRGDEWVDLTTQGLFAAKRVVVFALPGAFTPTCSSAHLPRYDQLVPVFRALGIDDVVCISVNDGFVMEAWGREQNVRHVTLIPDGNGEFTEKMGMLVGKQDLGFGPRSWRYSMYVEDGVIRRMFIEPERPGDPYEVSDADTMLAWLAPETRNEEILIVTRPGCPHCARAKALLRDRGKAYEDLVLGRDISPGALRALSGATSVPQVFIDGEHVGGADRLEQRLAVPSAA